MAKSSRSSKPSKFTKDAPPSLYFLTADSYHRSKRCRPSGGWRCRSKSTRTYLAASRLRKLSLLRPHSGGASSREGVSEAMRRLIEGGWLSVADEQVAQRLTG